MSAERIEERVLCIKLADLPRRWVADAAMVKMTAEQFFTALEGIPFEWVPRSKAEEDLSYKQLIPYVLLQTTDGLHTGCYRRKGSEKRLHDFWSVGVGGHVNQNDCGSGNDSLAAIVNNGMERETSEEFRSIPAEIETAFHGVINEEITDVGHVHLGLVYRMHVWEMEGLKPGQELDSFGWIRTERIFQKPLELWSKMALKLLDSEWE